MTATPACGDIIEKLKALEPYESMIAAGRRVAINMSEAERDALLALVDARTFVFSCPSCGDPSSQTVEPEVDIHSGATYRCAECQAEVIFTAQTPEQYVQSIPRPSPPLETPETRA